MTTMSELVNKRAEVKMRIDALNSELKDHKNEQSIIDAQLLRALDDQGVDVTGNEKYRVSINEDVVPTVNDWDAVYQHVLEHKDFSLLYRRVNSKAYRELLELGEQVPGLSETTIRRINLRTR